MQLSNYHKGDYTPGKPLITCALWYLFSKLFVECSLIPFSFTRVFLLRLFGAKIGSGVVCKPGLRVKFPWRLQVGNNTWLGEDVWIDNLAQVTIDENSVVSQGAYLCTGNHDWNSDEFTLSTAPIHIKDQCWIAAKSTLLPGVTSYSGAVLTAGSVTAKDLEAWTIYSGNPAIKMKQRLRSS